jgi:sulfate/thiosulfate transport system permease protein
VLSAFRVSISASFYAAMFDAVFGLLIAWTLVRYRFFGKRFIDSLIDLPFALPTAVAGIALTTLYSNTGWIGQYLEPLGIKIAYTPLGISLALAFIGLPFVVRTVQPVLEACSKDVEQAAACLGASSRAIFFKVIFPEILPAILTGSALAFARGIGEYGSVVFISGNMPLKTEIVPLLIMTKLEQFDYVSASAIAVVFLFISFLIVFSINLLQWLSRKKYGDT